MGETRESEFAVAKLSHSIPTTPWRATSPWSFRPRMAGPLIGGLTLFGIGEGLLVAAHWGAAPWTVFAQGISAKTGLAIGLSTALVSFVVLLAWIPLRERPGLGTIANLVLIATALDATVSILGPHHAFVVRVIFVATAIELIALGSALYLTTGLGPGPRDGLMTSLHRRFGVSVVYVRAALEGSVLLVGWLLGGVVGVSTALFAVGIGFAIGLNLKIVATLAARIRVAT